jgi:hypothetical protein
MFRDCGLFEIAVPTSPAETGKPESLHLEWSVARLKFEPATSRTEVQIVTTAVILGPVAPLVIWVNDGVVLNWTEKFVRILLRDLRFSRRRRFKSWSSGL